MSGGAEVQLTVASSIEAAEAKRSSKARGARVSCVGTVADGHASWMGRWGVSRVFQWLAQLVA